MKLEEIVLLGSRPQLRAGFQQICFVALISIRVFAFWANVSDTGYSIIYCLCVLLM
ncbi:hypothetical protein GLYMA_03G259900v4 [Glycine max]|uniref:Uncharacterized protein n=2 Tax=Glycine subgen. Soja TaxID=1462606 RepID=A0A0R0KYN6_SOYBN|nr:hypothetical protein JHK87_008430 [Glycine soja]KAG5056307.1 hypothetical protein JHK85_008817 [Glycine max]KAG5073371.1 hypothetical protein JHK86_008582 [Glycine max]KAH1071892.1 hypothetical protein GYH30_008404 [Glycine max]KRH68948.1 hypothetical protein GLYMA_03G259900v4 [Glycine max]